MKIYSNHSEKACRTLDSNPRASRQASIDVILQKYQTINSNNLSLSIPKDVVQCFQIQNHEGDFTYNQHFRNKHLVELLQDAPSQAEINHCTVIKRDTLENGQFTLLRDFPLFEFFVQNVAGYDVKLVDAKKKYLSPISNVTIEGVDNTIMHLSSSHY